MVEPEINVLQLIKGLDFGNHSGGSDKFGFELTKALRNEGIQVKLACLNRFESEIEREILSELRSLSIPFVFIEGNSPLAKINSPQLTKFCLQDGINIINSHFQVGTLAAIRARRFGYKGKIVRTAHIDNEWGEGPLAWILRETFTKVIFPIQTDMQVGVSNNIVKTVNNYTGTRLIRRQAVVIQNGISKNWFEPAPENKDFSKKRKLIGSIGLLIERKGYQYLIEAMPKVFAHYPEYELIIVGEGSYRPILEKQIRELGLQEKVKLLGRQTDPRFWLEQMDLFILPSLIEGLPTVIIESMARGVPVVASDIPGNDELILDGETGWLVRARSSDELADTILRVFADPLSYRKVSSQALNWAREFTIEKAAKKYALLYKQAIKDLDLEQ
jgi:glycosyltransferase involved in cell wall biosynthesis